MSDQYDEKARKICHGCDMPMDKCKGYVGDCGHSHEEIASKDREIEALKGDVVHWKEKYDFECDAVADRDVEVIPKLKERIAALTKELQEARVKIQEDLEWFKKMRASYEKERDRLRITLYFYASGNVESIRGELARNTLAASQEKKP